jgi:hypothetical protein
MDLKNRVAFPQRGISSKAEDLEHDAGGKLTIAIGCCPGIGDRVQAIRKRLDEDMNTRAYKVAIESTYKFALQRHMNR